MFYDDESTHAAALLNFFMRAVVFFFAHKVILTLYVPVAKHCSRDAFIFFICGHKLCHAGVQIESEIEDVLTLVA